VGNATAVVTAEKALACGCPTFLASTVQQLWRSRSTFRLSLPLSFAFLNGLVTHEICPQLFSPFICVSVVATAFITLHAFPCPLFQYCLSAFLRYT